MKGNVNCSMQLHTHTFNGPFSRTTRVSRYQKGKTNLDFTVARDSEWQWHQLGHMQVCTLLQTDNHASNPPLSFFTGRMPFLPPNQQRQSTEGIQPMTAKQQKNQQFARYQPPYSRADAHIMFQKNSVIPRCLERRKTALCGSCSCIRRLVFYCWCASRRSVTSSSTLSHSPAAQHHFSIITDHQHYYHCCH